MLQRNSFFSCPVIFFGTHEISEEEWMCENEEWNFSDPWHIATNQTLQIDPQNKIGLFILWPETDEPE